MNWPGSIDLDRMRKDGLRRASEQGWRLTGKKGEKLTNRESREIVPRFSDPRPLPCADASCEFSSRLGDVSSVREIYGYRRARRRYKCVHRVG